MRIRSRALSPSIHVAASFLCLLAGPSSALTFSTSGPGMAPCGEQMCVDVNWSWDGDSPESSGEVTLALPIPDPEVWQLSGGTVQGILGGASYGGIFDTSVLDPEPQEPLYVGNSFPQFYLFGADGSLLGRSVTFLVATCSLGTLPAPPTIECRDGNPIGSQTGEYYEVVPGDAALLGPLTLRYDYDPDWYEAPLSEFYSPRMVSGRVHLIYDAIPEPSTGVLVMTGLLGLAYLPRRHGREA